VQTRVTSVSEEPQRISPSQAAAMNSSERGSMNNLLGSHDAFALGAGGADEGSRWEAS
jgi:hypothetical protein